MLPGLIALPAAVGLLLNGSWDLWAQSVLLLALIAGLAAWLCWRILVGYLLLPSGCALAWVAALAAISGFSAYLSPLSCYAVPAWRAWLPALGIFCLIPAVSKDGRFLVDEVVRAAGWILVLLAFYQRFHDGLERPYSSLLNQNVFAGAVLLLLPLAAQKKDWVLGLGLLTCLWWSKSVGAWLGLSGALLATRRYGRVGPWIGGAAGFACLVAIYGKLQSAEVLNRWQWWSAALRMAWERPWLGFGPGTYAYLLPVYEDPGRPLASLFAHQHILETATEAGIPYVLLWVGGLLHCLRRAGPHKGFGALAVLIQSLWDYALSIPAVLWLFSYFSASSIPESSRGINVSARWKLPLCAGVLLAAAVSWRAVQRQWKAESLRVQAAAFLEERSLSAEERALGLLGRSWILAPHSETARLAAQIKLRQAQRPGPETTGLLLEAAEQLELAARLNPYRSTTRTLLRDVYRRLGREPIP